MLTKVNSAGTTSYAWDYENRLTKVSVVRTFETSLAQGPSYTFGLSSPVSFRLQRPRL
jgi:hypothetical protein